MHRFTFTLGKLLTVTFCDLKIFKIDCLIFYLARRMPKETRSSMLRNEIVFAEIRVLTLVQIRVQGSRTILVYLEILRTEHRMSATSFLKVLSFCFSIKYRRSPKKLFTIPIIIQVPSIIILVKNFNEKNTFRRCNVKL